MVRGGDISDSSSSAFPPLPRRGAVVFLKGAKLTRPSGLHLALRFSSWAGCSQEAQLLTPGQGHQAGGHVSLSL